MLWRHDIWSSDMIYVLRWSSDMIYDLRGPGAFGFYGLWALGPRYADNDSNNAQSSLPESIGYRGIWFKILADDSRKLIALENCFSTSV